MPRIANATTKSEEHPTPQMVRAGILALLSCDTRVDTPESTVEAVWEAMNSAKKR
jgi:hypothetical protein